MPEGDAIGERPALTKGNIKALRRFVIVGLFRAGVRRPSLLAEAGKCSAAYAIQILIEEGLHVPRKSLRQHMRELEAAGHHGDLIEAWQLLSDEL